VFLEQVHKVVVERLLAARHGSVVPEERVGTVPVQSYHAQPPVLHARQRTAVADVAVAQARSVLDLRARVRRRQQDRVPQPLQVKHQLLVPT